MENLVREFVCPNCGESETISTIMCREEKEKGHIPEGAFVSMEKVVSPIMGSGGPVGLTVPGILVHYDVCNRCGTRYCVRAEKIKMPISMTIPKQNQEPFGGFHRQ